MAKKWLTKCYTVVEPSSPRFVSTTDSKNDKKLPPPSPKKTKRTKKASPRSSPNDDSDSDEEQTVRKFNFQKI